MWKKLVNFMFVAAGKAPAQRAAHPQASPCRAWMPQMRSWFRHVTVTSFLSCSFNENRARKGQTTKDTAPPSARAAVDALARHAAARPTCAPNARPPKQANIDAGQHRSHLDYIVCIGLPLNWWVVMCCNACACSGQAPTGRLRSSRSTCTRCKWPHTSPIQSQVTSH